ncbi:hypothetical protein CI238_00662 [Colletotrichum incanum]|uniref:Uncharacterized protein n=1 Tax=Colletotrichum incanum TaxID=1573173 RepID=A0A161VZ93_COLIC|nr:hypothetical protein CI238_00662 [Colletotrichum incanum]
MSLCSSFGQSTKCFPEYKRIAIIITLGLVITTTLSSILIIASSRKWTVNRTWYESPLGATTSSAIHLRIPLIEILLEHIGASVSKRVIIEFIIQSFAHILSLFQVSTIALLTRNDVFSKIFSSATTTQSLKDFGEVELLRPRQNTRPRFLISIITFSYLGIFLSALWKEAMTPTGKNVVIKSSLEVPSFSNTTLIKEYPIESSQLGPSATTKDGVFSYSVGTKLLNGLIESGSSATTPDRTIRIHPKIDNTRFFYKGRSYGVGSSVGIEDSLIRGQSSVRMYHFQEAGYVAQVECHYNRSMDFHIESEYPHRTFAVTGFLPDTVGSAQWSEYIGQTQSSIVAVGVAHSPDSPRRYISIAAGDHYGALNATQCTIDFLPTMFQVSVDVKDRIIAVTPLMGIEDFDAQRTLTRTVVRQFNLIANSLMSFHESVLGNAFYSSIAAWNSSFNEMGHVPETGATLLGLQNSLTAMTDSILAGYGAAQLVVGNLSKPAGADIVVDVFTVDSSAHIAAVAFLNALAVLLCLL